MTASLSPPPIRAQDDPTADSAEARAPLQSRLRHWLNPTHRLGTAMLAMVTAWFALWSWRPMVELPGHFLGVALFAGILIASSGALTRAVRVPHYAVPIVQVIVAMLFLAHHYASAYFWHGLVPTASAIAHLADRCRAGATAINTYVAPVSSDHTSIYPYLAVSATAIVLAMDLLACTLRRVPLAALPLLLTLSIPISILDTPLNLLVFVITALLYLLLLAGDEVRRVLLWGRPVVSARDSMLAAAQRLGGPAGSKPDPSTGKSVRAVALRLGVLATLAALVVPLLLPMAHGWFAEHRGPGGTSGSGGMTVVNPMLDLRRNLVQSKRTPLVYASTSDPTPRYVRLTVLDEFTGDMWKPSPRNLPSSNRVHGTMPAAPGLLSAAPGQTYTWHMQLDDSFKTSWLPLPYPVRRLSVNGDWRYDTRTLDVVDTGKSGAGKGMTYDLTAFKPRYDALSMNAAEAAPDGILGPMTALPDNLPKVIRQTALQVAQPKGTPAVSNYEMAVRLQDWFRSDGGFTYSLQRSPGSGMGLIADFITRDKVGYCEQFAAAMAIMARSLDIPARVVVGFQRPGSVDNGRYVFTTNELHAWPELYFPGEGWVPFEPTPGQHTGQAPAYTTQDVPSAAPSATTPTQLPSGRRTPVKSAHRSHLADPQRARHAKSSPWLPVGIGMLLVVVLAATPRVLRDARRRRRLSTDQRVGVLAEGVWAELRATARDLGLPWEAERSPRQTMGVLLGELEAGRDLRADGETVVDVVERARYAPAFELDAEERSGLLAAAHRVTDAMRLGAGRGRARLALFVPMSVLSRGSRPAYDVDVRDVDETV